MTDVSNFLHGYPGMMPLGQSYVVSFSQGVLHREIPPNPNDPSLPNDADLLDFLDACNGQPLTPSQWNYGAYDASMPSNLRSITDPDRSGWGSDQISAAISYAKGPANVQVIRDVYQAFKNNGPIPTDAESTTLSTDLWGPNDNVVRERHIYFYGRQAEVLGGTSGLDGTAALYCQIQGASLSTNTWVLPRISSAQTYYWRYSGPVGGPMRTGGNQWTGVMDLNGWFVANAQSLIAAALIVAMAIFTVFTAGVALVAVPAIAGVIAAVGVASGAAAVALATTVWTAIAGLGGKLLVAAFTGDSSGVVPALIDTGASFGKVGVAGLDKLSQDPQFGKAVAQIKDLAKTFDTLKNQIPSQAQQLLGKNFSDKIGPWLDAAASQAKKLDPVDWKSTMSAIGAADEFGKELPGTVSNYFMSQARKAANSAEIIAVHEAAPWYAKGFTSVAGTLRAVEIVQQAPNPMALAMPRDNGFRSVAYQNSPQGRAEAAARTPGLMRVGASAGGTSPDSGSLSKIGRLNVTPVMVKTATVAVPVAVGGSFFLRYVAKEFAGKAFGDVVEGYFGWWLGGALTIAGIYAVSKGNAAAQPLVLKPPSPQPLAQKAASVASSRVMPNLQAISLNRR